MLLWEEVSERIRECYVVCIFEIIIVVLNIVFEENVVCLWNVLLSLCLIFVVLGIDMIIYFLENVYLEVLVEVYKNMFGWDIK